MKKNIFSVCAVVILFSMCVLTFASCADETQEKESYEYVPSGGVSSDDNTTASQNGTDNASSEGKYTVDESWKKNYSVSYTYYDTESSVTSLKINESKCEDAIIVTEENSGSTQYYKANGKDVDCYIIIDGNEKQAHSVLENTDFDSLDSFFMQKSFVDADMPMEKNVLYMGDETVAGRQCCKYILAEYKDSVRVRHIYVWVDVQYGFAARLEAYDSESKLTQKWEISEFSTGSVQPEEVTLDVSAYTFEEAE